MKTEIEISIDNEGNISYTVKGMKGKDCEKETKFLDDIGDVTERKYTSEYYQQQSQGRRIQSRR